MMMSGGKGGGGSLSGQQPKLHALRVKTAAYGQIIPLMYGQGRIAGKLIWTGDFKSIPHASQTSGGGKGGGGSQNTSTVTYTYTVAAVILLCHGAITGIRNVWDTRGKLSLVSTTEVTTVPAVGPYTVPVTQATNFYGDDGVALPTAYSVGVNDYGSPGPATLAGTQNVPLAPVVGVPSANQYAYAAGVYTFNAAQAGQQVSINYTYSVPDSSGASGIPASKLNVTLFTGTATQTAWGYLTSSHPAEARNYRNIAIVVNSAFDLGTSGTFPNYTWELAAKLRFGGGVVDSACDAVVTDFLTNTIYGAEWPGTALDTTQFGNFCTANGIFISPTMEQQKPAAEWLKELLEATNTAPVMSEGKLKLKPYGDTSAVGYGVQFTPDTTPRFDLSDLDYMPDGNEDPVVIERTSAADAFNVVRIEFLNRANSYNPEIVEEKDDSAIALYGIRPMDVKAYHFITDKATASKVAVMLLKRQVYIRAKARFKVGFQYEGLEPMDLVTLTDANTGMVKVPWRITSIEEDPETHIFQMEAEEFPWGTANPTQYPKETAGGYVPTDTADPGLVNTPIIFEINNKVLDVDGYAAVLGVSGASADWGGCTIWGSTDGVTYRRLGQMFGPSRMGVLQATLPNVADPDTTSVLDVDLAQSHGVLLAGTQNDVDTYRTLFWVDGELAAYRDAVLVSGNRYQLDYLRRGAYGTPISSHASGTAKFLRIDDAVAKLTFSPQDVGKTIHLKFTSFNTRMLNEQSLGQVADYTFTVTGTYNQIPPLGKNLLANPGWEEDYSATPLNTDITLGPVGDHWLLLTAPPSYWSVQVSTSVPQAGTNCCRIRLKQSVTVPSDNVPYKAQVLTELIPVKPGDKLYFGAQSNQQRTANFAAGAVGTRRVGLVVYGRDVTTALAEQTVDKTNFTATFSEQSGLYTVPGTIGGKVPAFVRVQLCGIVQNNSGAGVVTSSNDYADIRFDGAFCIVQYDPTTQEINKVGSLAPGWNGSMTYTSTTTSITWSWSGLTFTRSDGAVVAISNGSQAITGLSVGTTYFFYPYMDEATLTLKWATAGVSSGSPTYAYVAKDRSAAAEQGRQDHDPLSQGAMQAATTSAGTGGGSGGGDGSCLRENMLVWSNRGVIRADEVRVGDMLRCPEGWTNVTMAEPRRQHVFMRLATDRSAVEVTPSHPMEVLDQDGAPCDVRAGEAHCMLAVQTPTGADFLTAVSVVKDPAGRKMAITCNPHHHFYAGEKQPDILTHNVVNLS
jgi:hypothetical protein